MNIFQKLKIKKDHTRLIIIFVVIAILIVGLIFNSLSDRGAKADLTSLQISGFPDKVSYSSDQTFTLTAKDGETIFEDYGGAVSFSSTDNTAELPSDYTFKNNTKDKAISINGWNSELEAHEYDNITDKMANNNISDAYIGVYETTNVGKGLLFCENDFAFGGVTSDENYDLNDFITSATTNSIDTYAWITIFGPEQTLDIDADDRLENTWVDPASTEHLAYINDLVDHLLTNYTGLKGIVVDYIRYADAPNSNLSDGDNVDEAEYRVYEDGDTYSDYTGNFAPGNATTIISDVVDSIATTVHGFVGKEIAVETYSAHNDSVYSWVTDDLGQDYALLAPNIDILIPLAYHIGWYDASWIAEVVDYIYAITNPVEPDCEIWPKVQTWQEDKDTNWPGPAEIENAVEPIDYAKVGGLGFYVYGHMSDDEWVEVRDCFDDNGTKEFQYAVSFKQLGPFDLIIEDEIAGISVEKNDIEVFYGHPSGSLVTSIEASKVYLIENNYKKWVRDASVYTYQYNWSDIAVISNTELEKYTDGSDFLYPNGALISNNNKVYLIDNQEKRWITDASIFIGLGFRWRSIVSTSNAVADAYSNGSDINFTDSHSNGTVITAPGESKVYILDQGQKRWIQNANIFLKNYESWNRIAYISSEEISNYPDGATIGRRDGSLIHDNNKVYVLENSKKHWITSSATFLDLKYKWGNIQYVNNSELELYADLEEIVEERFSNYGILIYGDSRTGHTTHQNLVNKMLVTNPKLTLHTGDLVSTGDSATDWNNFNNITSELRSETSFYPTIGNHELPIADYLTNFVLPNNEQWYSVDDNNVHYIILDSTTDISLGSAQYTWLENDLNNIGGDINFTVAVFHHPPYNTGAHDEDDAGFQTDIIPLFESKDVDIVFNGHDHNYERSFVNGIYYVVAGGGGAPLYNQTRSSDYSQVFLKKNCFSRMIVKETQLTIQTYDQNLTKIDEFVIGENPPVAFYSDNQSDSDADDTRHQTTVDRILNTFANPIFHAGDLQEDGTIDSLNRFNAVTNTLRSERNFYAALGNNESNTSLYFDNFTFPNNERWYSVNSGNLHMIVLDNTYSSVAIGSAQYTWLEADLASDDSQNRITGVMFHYPAYNETGDPKGMTNTVVPLFRDYGVDFVIAGHVHAYRKETVDGIYYFTNTGQTSLGYMIANILENEVWLNVYNSNNTLVDTVIFDER